MTEDQLIRDVITIDGPSGAGKSTVSRIVAERLGYRYLDTGALYRAVAWKVRDENAVPEDGEKLCTILNSTDIAFEGNKVLVNGRDVSTQIREQEISELSSRVSAIPMVREHLFTMQRELGLKGRIVIEGRDIGTAIFPDAENKFFLDASIEERARRRYEEFREKTSDINLNDTMKALDKRDKRDSTRQSAPLKRSGDMVYIDTSNLSLEEVVSRIMETLKTP
ncbi:MAG: (d)CMP kinase [Nitrospiraceae bacterium]|nr:MAG: (d)CMP kinase [Nitrospiraceae bacterium]